MNPSSKARANFSERPLVIVSLVSLVTVLVVGFALSRPHKSKSPIALGGDATGQLTTTTTIDPLKVAVADAEKESRKATEVYWRMSAEPVTDLKASRDEMSNYFVDPALNVVFQAFQVVAINGQRTEGSSEDHYIVTSATPTEVQFEICGLSHVTTINRDGTRIAPDSQYRATLERDVLIDGTWKVAQVGPKGGGRGDVCSSQ